MNALNNEQQLIERKSYCTFQGLECLNSCIYNYLKNDDINITQSDIFFYGGGFDIRYSWSNGIHKIKSKQYQANLPFIKNCLKKSINDNMIESIEGEMLGFIQKKILDGKKIILNVSSSNLQYNKAFDRGKIVQHYINLIGLDTQNKLVKISDGCAPVVGGGCFEDWLNIDEIIENWQLMNGHYIELHYDKIDVDEIKHRAYDNMKNGIKKYIHKDKAIFRTHLNGYQTIVRLFEDIGEMLQYNMENSLNIIRNINEQLKIGGYLNSKRFLLEKMKEIKCDEELVSAYETIIKEYDMICLQTIKCVIKKNIEEINSLVLQIKHLADDEIEILREVLTKY